MDFRSKLLPETGMLLLDSRGIIKTINCFQVCFILENWAKKLVYREETALADFRSKLLPETGISVLDPRGKMKKVTVSTHVLFFKIVRRNSFTEKRLHRRIPAER